MVRCTRCKGTRVQCMDWVYPNTEHVGRDGQRYTQLGNGDAIPYGDAWCDTCGAETTLEVDGEA